MFYNDRSDYGALVAGLFFMSIVAIALGAVELALGLDKADMIGTIPGYASIAVMVCGIVIAGFSLSKGYIVEGMTFAVVAIACYFIPQYSLIIGIVIVLAFLVLAFISYHVGYLDLIIFDVLMAVATVLLMCIDGDSIYTTAGGIVMIVAGVISLYVCICDWMDVQDTLEMMEEAMMEADDCCCGDDCDDECDCGDDCECHCHHKEEE